MGYPCHQEFFHLVVEPHVQVLGSFYARLSVIHLQHVEDEGILECGFPEGVVAP
jgi:hypothetical protein